MAVTSLGIIELVLLMGMGGGLGLPLGVPPLPEDPVLARVAPEECLFYTSWAGTAEPNADSPNQTERLLAEPEVRHLVAEVRRLIKTGIHEAAMENEGPDAASMADDAVRWAETLLTRPTAVFVSKVALDRGVPDLRAGAAVNVGDDIAELKATLEKYQARFLREAVEPVEIGDDTWYRITLDPRAPEITWGVKSNYFVIAAGKAEIEGMVERARTDPPEWLAKISEQLPVARRSTVTYVNVKALADLLVPLAREPMVGRVVEALGLKNVDALISVTGLDQTGFVSKALVSLDGEPQGFLRLAAAEPLDPDDLAPIPRDATVALAFRLDPEQLLDTVLSVAGKIDPNAREDILEGIEKIRNDLGFELRSDLLGPLGDVWCVYNSPGEGGLVITGLTAVIQVEDRQKLAATLKRFFDLLQAEMDRRGGRRSPRIEQFEFAGHEVYMFNARDDDFPLAPSWCLTEDALVVAPFPQNIKAYLSRGEEHHSIAELPEVAGLFQSGAAPVKLWYVDTRELFELLYPLTPVFAQVAFSELARQGIDVNVSILPSARAISRHLGPTVGAARLTDAGIEILGVQSVPGGNPGAMVPIAAGMLFTGFTRGRGAAVQTQSVNNLRQIGLALHNYHDVFKTFPPAYSTDPDGKPLLSWRVHILPFVEAAGLYEQFHLDEPWDSEHNKTLIPRMPRVFRPRASKAGPGKTNYLGVGGEAGIFPGKEKVRFADIKDGTSNTMAVVEADDPSAVIWTKPGDFVPDSADPFGGLIGLQREGFLALFADGRAELIHEGVDPDWLRATFTRDGGERPSP